MSNNTHGSPSSKPRLCPSTLTQIQIERLKREDEDEHWISGEELYTEGSSDDEEDRVMRGPVASDCIIHSLGNIRVGSRGPVGQTGRPRWGHPGPPRGQTASSTSHRQIPSTETKEKIGCVPSEMIDQDKSRPGGDMLDSKTEPSLSEDQTKSFAEDETEPIEERSEISWRPKREEGDESRVEMLEETIIELKELRLGYRDILDSVSELKSLNEKKVIIDDDSPDTDVSAAAVIYKEVESALGVINSDSRTRIEDMYSIFREYGERSCSDLLINEDELRKEFLNVVRLDTWIGKLDEKVKKESEDRRLEEVLNREELKRLRSLRGPESAKLAKNSIEFFELCSQTDKEIYRSSVKVGEDMSEAVKIDSIYPPESENFEMGELDLEGFDYDEESRGSRREQLEEELMLIDKKKRNFIERNKELAACGIGTLSITDEEKKRLEELVEDYEDDNDRSTFSLSPYRIDREADQLLKNLTEQLTNINSETYRKAEGKEEEEDEEEVMGDFLSHKEQHVINSLRTFAEPSSQMIHPISEDEIKQLIDEYYVEKNSSTTSSRPSIDDSAGEVLGGEVHSGKLDEENSRASLFANSENPIVTREVIEQLVREAKTQMPLFQFKYHDDVVEGTDNGEKNN